MGMEGMAGISRHVERHSTARRTDADVSSAVGAAVDGRVRMRNWPEEGNNGINGLDV